jgi:L-threonylcarbamoyladenylate synthase
MQDYDKLISRLKQGDTLLYPTDTVYGLGCDALNDSAVARVQRAKGREPGKPFLILAGSLEQVQECFELPTSVEEAIQNLWPGPYTLLLTPKASFARRVSSALVGSTGKVGVRVPNVEDGHFLKILFQCWDGMLTSTSANMAGEPYSEEWDTLESLFQGRVDHLIKEGSLQISTTPSALLDWDGEWKVLREGIIPERELLEQLR